MKQLAYTSKHSHRTAAFIMIITDIQVLQKTVYERIHFFSYLANIAIFYTIDLRDKHHNCHSGNAPNMLISEQPWNYGERKPGISLSLTACNVVFCLCRE